MESINLIWIASGIAFFAGGVAGSIAMNIFSGSGQANRDLEKKLTEVEAEFENYRNKVNQHFSTTADLTRRMTENYRDIYEHIANSANILCEDENTRFHLTDGLLSSTVLSVDTESESAKTAMLENVQPVEQPKDYAPKKHPDDDGMLSEDFSIKANQSAENSGADTPEDGEQFVVTRADNVDKITRSTISLEKTKPAI